MTMAAGVVSLEREACRRILLIDGSKSCRERLVEHFAARCPEVTVDQYEPGSAGVPGPDFPWSDYQLVLLDADLGGRAMGLRWLRVFGGYPDMPPIVVLDDQANLRTAIRAIKLGAEDYLLKRKLQDGDPLHVIADHACLEEEDDGALETTEEDTRLIPLTGEPRAATGGGGHLDPDTLQVPGYQVIRKLADGGMSSVLLAERREDALPVVLKVMATQDSDDPQALKRFMQEYTLIGELDHPNVVHIYERAFARDYAYIAMEYFPGGDLHARLKAHIDVAATLDYTRQIAGALAAVHDLDVVHRDLKPANILFREDDTPCITDFGVAKDVSGNTREITVHNMLIGTPYYMSPEQAIGGRVDARSDLYALGVMFYQMLTGTRPYQARTMAELIRAHVREAVPRLPEAYARYQPIVDGLLAKDPDERFQSAHELLTGLDWIE